MIRWLVAGLAVAAAAAGFALAARGEGEQDREAEVAARGRTVMPFDLERTTHVFTRLPDGGVQRVVADGGDRSQIPLIRAHLRSEARRFARGDFGDPAAIHGAHMPGLRTLRAHAAKLDVRYAPIARGARIRYRSRDARVVKALHAWFAAQLADHGSHAAAG